MFLTVETLWLDSPLNPYISGLWVGFSTDSVMWCYIHFLKPECCSLFFIISDVSVKHKVTYSQKDDRVTTCDTVTMSRPAGVGCLPIPTFLLPVWIFLLRRSFQPQGHSVFLIVVPLCPRSPQRHQPPAAQMMNDCTLWKGPSPINKLISPLSLWLLPVNNELWVSLLITIIVNVKRGPLASCPTPNAFIDFIFLH